MGYKSKDIAVINEPDIITLSALPNFVQFASKPATKTILELNIKINVVPTTPTLATRTVLNIVSSTGEVRSFHGTTVASEVGANVYYVSADTSDTAENLRQALISDPWIKSNFEVVTPFTWVNNAPVNGSTINIKAKGAGTEFLINVTAPNNTGNSAYLITWVNNTSVNNDSISGEDSTAEIELDVYVDPAVFLGADDRPLTAAKIGHYLTTLSKTYAGQPLWFELNALFNQYPGYNIPNTAPGWFNPGTLSAYRFFAKVKNINSYSFYQSNTLYVVNGYGRVSDDINIDDYVYTGPSFKLLSNKPKTPYVRGQREYLNFILKDDQRDSTNPIEFSLRVIYRAYTTAGDFLGEYYAHARNRVNFEMVNTCTLDIDTVLDLYPNAGIIKVSLARDTAIISNDLEYEIMPEALHTLQQFTFLNKLGGWDNFNMDAAHSQEIKPESLTYNKTLTPAFKKGDSLETVYSTTLGNSFTVEGAPVYDDVAEWLKELAAAKVILNNEGFYVIVESFEMVIDPKTQDMQRPKLKYRLSENFTND